MAAPVSLATDGQWPADVREFAARNQVAACLDPLREGLLRLFPTTRSFRAFLEDDPEIPDDWHIVFELHVPSSDVPDYVAATRPWYREVLPGNCPNPLTCIFRLRLLQVDS
jgi:hypothetical protein